jgi:hypothetical protein
MAKGIGTYDDPIICDGLFFKKIDGVKKFFKIKTGSNVDTSNFIKKTGDTVNGQLTFSDNYYIQKTDDAHHIRINSCTANDKGAGLMLYGKDVPAFGGNFDLVASNGVSEPKRFVGTPNGSLRWCNSEVERVKLKSANYFRFVSGLTFMWGLFGVDEGLKRKTVNLPIPFNSAYNVILTNQGNDKDYGSNLGYQVVIKSLSSFDIQHSWEGSTGWYYLAIGY